MPDRTIPFYNTILRCDTYMPRKTVLPEGFAIVPYREGYEEDWARLECGIGDFGSLGEAKEYFVSSYLGDGEKRSDLLFLLEPQGRVIGSCLAWKDKRGDAEVSSLHWLVVEEAYRGRGLGRALCLAVMERYAARDAFPVYIHTQPWSWEAILLYLSIGFRLQRTDTFSRYENQYGQAMETLRGVVSQEQYERMRALSEG